MNLNLAVWSVPSTSRTLSSRQVPAQPLSVFQTYLYRPFTKTSPSSDFVFTGGPIAAPVVQSIWTETGYPSARMSSPRSPPRLNLTGIALPAMAGFSAGGLEIGGKKPVKGQVIAKSDCDATRARRASLLA